MASYVKRFALFLSNSSTANQHRLQSLSHAGAGAYEYFSSSVKSRWQGKIKATLQKVAAPALTDVAVEWTRYADHDLEPAVQAPSQVTALFSGSRQVVYGFVDDCMQATLKAMIDGYEVSTMVSTSDLSITKGKVGKYDHIREV